MASSKASVVVASLLTIVFVLVSYLSSILAKFLPNFQPEFVVLVVNTILVLGGIFYWGHAKEMGFNSFKHWKRLPLWAIPVIVVFVIPLVKGMKEIEMSRFLYLVLAYSLTGIMEEGFARGIILGILKPLGVNKSIIISSVLFAMMHAVNFLYRNFYIVLLQMIGAFVHGIGLGAIKIKSNTIWFVIILHAAHDLLLQYSNFPLIPIDVLQVTLLMIYGLYLLKAYSN